MVARTGDSEPAAQLQVAASGARSIRSTSVSELEGEDELDRIPVRLTGGRRAWLVIPTPFYSADKSRLKAQIDLLLTAEEEGDEEG